LKPARQRVASTARPDSKPRPAGDTQVGLRLRVNGQPVDMTVPARTTLAALLRDQLHLYGTKLGCNEGTCGSCTVQVDGVPMYACMMLASDASGRQVLTIEGLGTPEKPHVLQSVFAETYAAQCGYCTPGLILTAEALLRKTPHPGEADVKNALSGNLCKCAAYPEIVAAVLQAAKLLSPASDVHPRTKGRHT
jgi:aerobic-type carbon monoxide dehydrogenase small subunit (CoxS/CutS family)